MHISPSSDTFEDMNKDKPEAPKPVDDGKGMPDLQGMSIKEASQTLAQRGLGIDIQGNGLAKSQSIAPGTAIQQGQTVTVTFSP